MIKFKSVEYRNIMSIGNHPIKINLDENLTTIVGGSNGSGKSSSITALVYCLYGKIISGMKLEQAINSINKKGLVVKVEFERYGEEWVVIRGEKPKKFEIYRDGELMDQYANSKDQQKFLEMILGMDYKLFTQIVVINKERYVPFMEMNAAERRKMIEDILDISVFSYMNDALKKRIQENDGLQRTIANNHQLWTTELKGKQELIAQIQSSIDSSTAIFQSRKAEIEARIAELTEQVDSITEQIEGISLDGFAKVKKTLSELNSLSVEFDGDIKRLQKDKEFFINNDSCPTCGQEIEDGIKHEHIADIDNSINSIQEAASEMVDALTELLEEKERFEALEAKLSELKRERTSVMNNLSYSKKELQEVEAKIEQAKTSSDQKEKLEAAIAEYEAIEKKIEDNRVAGIQAEQDRRIIDQVRDYLKDDGIKAQIVKEYNSILNKKINEYLNAMGFYVHMTIDENFKETFHSMNREGFTYENLSTGQKCRVSIAITLALLEVGSIKNSASTNLLYIDEWLEPLDSQGVKDVMNLIRTKLAHKNTFVITQRFDEFSHLFESQIRFKLSQGFTEFETNQ